MVQDSNAWRERLKGHSLDVSLILLNSPFSVLKFDVLPSYIAYTIPIVSLSLMAVL